MTQHLLYVYFRLRTAHFYANVVKIGLSLVVAVVWQPLIIIIIIIRKETKYSSLPPDFIFQPVAIETLDPLNASVLNFLKWGGSPVDFFIWRFSRDLISVPTPLNAYTALQLCSDYGLLLLLWRRPGPLATNCGVARNFRQGVRQSVAFCSDLA